MRRMAIVALQTVTFVHPRLHIEDIFASLFLTTLEDRDSGERNGERTGAKALIRNSINIFMYIYARALISLKKETSNGHDPFTHTVWQLALIQ